VVKRRKKPIKVLAEANLLRDAVAKAIKPLESRFDLGKFMGWDKAKVARFQRYKCV
jgi:hypothetical protein